MQDLYYAWASPLVRRDTGRHDLAKSMREVILENEDAEHAHPKPPQESHEALFESNFDFLNWPDPAVTMRGVERDRAARDQLSNHTRRYVTQPVAPG